jgi:hypothetical protein
MYILKTGINTNWAGRRFPAVNRRRRVTFHLNEYRLTTNAINDPKNRVRNTAGTVINAVFQKYKGRSIREIA